MEVNRSNIYYTPKGESEENLAIMRIMDADFRFTPLGDDALLWTTIHFAPVQTSILPEGRSYIRLPATGFEGR